MTIDEIKQLDNSNTVDLQRVDDIQDEIENLRIESGKLIDAIVTRRTNRAKLQDELLKLLETP